MTGILKRTTAIAALAALPLAPLAAHAESQQMTGDHGLQSQSALVPGEKAIDASKAQADTAPDTAQATRTDGGQVERMAPDTRLQIASDSTHQATSDGDAKGDAALKKVMQGQDTSPGVEPGQPPAQQQAISGGDAQQAEGNGKLKGVMQGQDTSPGVEPGQPPAQQQAISGDDAQQAEGDADLKDVMQGQDTSPGVEPGQPPAQQQQAVDGDAPDVLVARVGEKDIMRSDILGVIGQLPPQMQSQPAEMLIPLALDQLVLRELILQEARDAGLEEDEEVTSMAAEDAPQIERENAMVQVWLDRELEGAVTDAGVSETYGAIQQQMGAEAPPLEQIRPQIEQELRRQAFADISADLQADADVTLFGPDGEPLTR